jgi:hypothetical protein
MAHVRLWSKISKITLYFLGEFQKCPQLFKLKKKKLGVAMATPIFFVFVFLFFPFFFQKYRGN